MNIIRITSVVEIRAIENALHALQHEVYGPFEVLQLRDDAVMLVNESGAKSGMPQNPIASLVARTQVYGPAIIVGASGSEYTDVPGAYYELLMIDPG